VFPRHEPLCRGGVRERRSAENGGSVNQAFILSMLNVRSQHSRLVFLFLPGTGDRPWQGLASTWGVQRRLEQAIARGLSCRREDSDTP